MTTIRTIAILYLASLCLIPVSCAKTRSTSQSPDSSAGEINENDSDTEIHHTEDSPEHSIDAAVPTPNAVSLSNLSVEQCEYEIWRSPNDHRTLYQCNGYSQQLEVDLQVPLDAAVMNETIDEWRCDCGTEQQIELSLEAESCNSALERVCGISLDERNYCENGEGRCWPDSSQEDGWLCSCDVGKYDDTPLLDEVAPESAPNCKQAAFQHCASECESPLGQCKPNIAEQLYECDCEYYLSMRPIDSFNCQEALDRCNPGNLPSINMLSEAPFCNSYSGGCDLISEVAHCQCLNGIEREVDMTTNPNYPELQDEDLCDLVWELCGDESDEIKKWMCSAESEPGRYCYISYDFDMALYQCNCESVSECGDEYDFSNGEYEEENCTEALDSCTEDDSQRTPVEPEPC